MSRPLHLLEVGVRWPPETFLCWKLEGLARRGVRVTVASRSVFDSSQKLAGVELLDLGAPRSRLALARSPLRLARLLLGIARLHAAYRRRYGGTRGLLALYAPLAGLRPSVVHFEWPGSAALFRPLFGVWRCPVVTSCHGLAPDPPGIEGPATQLEWVMPEASIVHCVADWLRERVVEMGCEPAKARVIRQGIDPEAFSPGTDPADGTLRLVGIAWLRWMKGYEWALEAIRLAADRGVAVRLDILGAQAAASCGAERRRLEHTIADLGLESHVRVAPAASSAEVARALRGASALLHPSLNEGLPTVVLEAMSCAVPVIATDCGGVSEAVTDGVEGLLVAPRDSRALADAIERLWRDPGLGRRMGEAGRATAMARFALDRQLEEFLDLYEELARS